MRRLMRAAEAYIWTEAIVRVVGIVALIAVSVAAWVVLKYAAVTLI